MKTYTVVGFYEDTGQRFCDCVNAEDWTDAVTTVFKGYPDGNLTIVEVFEGIHTCLTASSQIEYREDWPGLEEEGEDE